MWGIPKNVTIHDIIIYRENTDDYRNDLSDLDHIMTRMTMEERLRFIEDIDEKYVDSLSNNKDIRVIIAATIEKVHRDLNKKPPDWVMQRKYTFLSVEECFVHKETLALGIAKGDRALELSKRSLEKSVPEFRWRNSIQDGIFDSY